MTRGAADGQGGGASGGRTAGPLRSLAALLAVVALPALMAACGGSGGDAEGGGAESPARDTVAAGGTDTAGGTAVADSAPADDPRPLRAFRFRIRNERGDTAVIVADAGAGTRALDTVPPADSAEVRVETRASLLELRARTGPGDELARSRYDLERSAGDTLLEFSVPPASSAPDSAAG